MRRTFDNPTLMGIGLVVALLLLIPVLTYRHTRQLNIDVQWVSHTHEVLKLNADVLTALVDAETGVRGFVITGRGEFLQPYHALFRLDGLMAELKEKAENPQQQARLTKLDEMAAVQLRHFKDAIGLRRKDEKAVKVLALASKSKTQMDAIRRHLAEMEQEANDLLKERKRKTAATYQVAVMSGLTTAVLGLFTTAAFCWLLKRSLLSKQQASAVIAQQAELMRTTLASIGDAVITTGTDDCVTSMNVVALDLTGFLPAEAIGQPLDARLRIVNEMTRKTIENPATRACREGFNVELTNHTVLIAKDGRERPIDGSASPIRSKDGEIVGCVLVFRDVTERKRLEQDILEIAEGVQHRIGQDLHDGLGQELTGIALLSKALANQLQESGHPAAAAAFSVANYSNASVESARRLARGLYPVELRSNGLLLALEDLAAYTSQLFGVSCTLCQSEPPRVLEQSSEIHIYRIVQECISNAIKHGKATCVRIESLPRQNEHLFAVTDNGSGFKNKPRGPGMGMRVMEYRARVIGAQISVSQPPEGGCRVECRLIF